MGLFNHFPYTNVHELNLDWVLSMMKALEAEWEAFTAGNSLQFADPMLHDISKTYAKNTIVLDGNGNAYVSLQAVPVGVGLQNGDYWLMVFDYEAFIEKVNKNFTARYYRGSYRATAAMAVGDWLTVDDVLCKATAAIAYDDILEVGVNIEHFTLEDFIKAFMQSANQLIQQYKNDIDASELLYRQQLAQDIANTTASLQAQLDAAISGATVDSEVILARVSDLGITFPTLGEAIKSQISILTSVEVISNTIESSGSIELTAGNLPNYYYHNGAFVRDTTRSCIYIPTSKGITDIYIKKSATSFDSIVLRFPDNTETGYAAGTGTQHVSITTECEIFINFWGGGVESKAIIYGDEYFKRLNLERKRLMDVEPLKITSGDYSNNYATASNIVYTGNDNYKFCKLSSDNIAAVRVTKSTNTLSSVVFEKEDNTKVDYAANAGTYVIPILEKGTIYLNFFDTTDDVEYTLIGSDYLRDSITEDKFQMASGGKTYYSGWYDHFYFDWTDQAYKYLGVSSYSSIRLDSAGISTLKFTKLSGSQPVVVLIDDNDIVTGYGAGTGDFEVNITEHCMIIINFFGNTYMDHITLYGNYTKEYESGYIRFTVPVNNTVPFPSTDADVLTDNETIHNVECILSLPATYSPHGKPTNLIMMCHGAGRGVNAGESNNWTTVPQYNALVNAFTSAGYAVFDCHGTSNADSSCESWGSPVAGQTWMKAYEYIIENYNVTKDFSIYGFSMGGLTALNLAFNDMPNIKCIALGSPVLDLAKCWAVASVKAEMQAAYGITYWVPELYAGNNPIGTIYQTGGNDYVRKLLPPIKMWYGDTEDGTGISYVNKADGQKLLTAIRNSNGTAILRKVAGAGHEICYGGNANCITEFVYWFNRFNN